MLTLSQLFSTWFTTVIAEAISAAPQILAPWAMNAVSWVVDMTIGGVPVTTNMVAEIIISVIVVLIYASILGVMFFALLVMFFSKL